MWYSGQSRTVHLSAAGDYAIRDRQVPHVRGALHVVADLVAVAAPGADGAFTFPSVAPGDYTLHVWEGAREATSQTLTVTQAHDVTLDPIVLARAAPAPAAH